MHVQSCELCGFKNTNLGGYQGYSASVTGLYEVNKPRKPGKMPATRQINSVFPGRSFGRFISFGSTSYNTNMRIFFKELFEYNFSFNQKNLNILIEKPEQVPERLLQLHSHIVNAHSIWNSRIIPAQINYKTWDTFSAKELIERDNKNFITSISILNEYDLGSEIQYSLSNGKSCANSIRDILFQIINHSTYHRGQIATEFRKCNIEPLLTDWIIYKMNQV